MLHTKRHLPGLFDKDDSEGTANRLIGVSQATNLSFYQLGQQGVMVYRDGWERGTTEVNIQRVGQRERRKIQRIAQHFPYDWPLHEQCAYLLRAYSGLQLYPDANHRTGMAIAAFHAFAHQCSLQASASEAARFVDDVRNPRSPLNARRTVNRILERDGSFRHLSDFYGRNLHKIPWFRWFMSKRQMASGSLGETLLTLVPAETEEVERRRKKK